ncbi:signal transduction histidine kinase [Eggerthella sp. CAG:1427]|nr:signal transduction histidine kinase [Eggerthella sp. CAG:1427]
MNSSNNPKSPQARILRGILFRKTLVYLTIYTLCFGVIALWANTYWVPDFANLVADGTSEWQYFTPEQYDAFVTESSAEQLSNIDVYSGTADDGSIQYAVRDLTTYHFIRSLKLPVALCLYFIGALVIAFIVLNKSLQYFDILSSSVRKLLNSKDTHVDLPDDLSIVRSELVNIKAQSIEAERHAINAEKRKNELVAYLAHDIKTPLTSILGYLTLLNETATLPDEQRRHYAEIALNKAEHLEGLIDEFFEITRYNLQSIPIERETFNLELFCQQIADDFYPEAKHKQLSIEVKPQQSTESPQPDKTNNTSPVLANASYDNEFQIFADPEKLARAVSNIMRNALAYAEPQSTITIELIPTPKGSVIAIRNKGKEISPTHLQSIFEKFFREDTSRNSKQGGAGLGLAIAKEIMLAHGGDITATSEHGITIFRLFIPAC